MGSVTPMFKVSENASFNFTIAVLNCRVSVQNVIKCLLNTRGILTAQGTSRAAGTIDGFKFMVKSHGFIKGHHIDGVSKNM